MQHFHFIQTEGAYGMQKPVPEASFQLGNADLNQDTHPQ
jgi:hypothetical protein